MTKVRLLSYPASTKDTGYATAYGHTDWGAFTLLAQDEIGGLEVCCETPHSGEPHWLPTPHIPDTLLVNVQRPIVS